MVRYVIFDLDNTLIHTPALEALFIATAVQYGATEQAATDVLLTSMGTPPHDLFETLGLTSAEADAASDSYHERLRVQPAQALEGAEDVLIHLTNRDIPLFLSTGSHPLLARERLEEYGWSHYFQLVCGTTRQSAKGPDHYRQFDDYVQTTGWTAHAATIGDGATDMRLGLQHDVPLRIGIADDTTMIPVLVAAGATDIVNNVHEALPLLTIA